MFRNCVLLVVILTASFAMAKSNVVDCDSGDSINRALSKTDRLGPATITVKGTCSEFIDISGFDGLTLKGLDGATLATPAALPENRQFLVSISASRSVTLDGFAIVSSPALPFAAVAIGGNSMDIRLRNLSIQGGSLSHITVYEASQVSIARVSTKDPGVGSVMAYDLSDVHIEDCLFEDSGQSWHFGMIVDSSHVTLHATVIKNMRVGMMINSGGMVNVGDFSTYYPSDGNTEVLIDNAPGTSWQGVSITSSLLNLGAKLRINNPGATWGVNTAGVIVSGGGRLNAGQNLIVSGSLGQGVLVTDQSVANLGGSSITGSSHGGVVAVNMSSVSLGPSTQLSGNAVDLFCDARSMITATANLPSPPTTNCANLAPGNFPAMP